MECGQFNTTDKSNVPNEDVIMTHSLPCKQLVTLTRQESVKTTLSLGEYQGGHNTTDCIKQDGVLPIRLI